MMDKGVIFITYASSNLAPAIESEIHPSQSWDKNYLLPHNRTLGTRALSRESPKFYR